MSEIYRNQQLIIDFGEVLDISLFFLVVDGSKITIEMTRDINLSLMSTAIKSGYEIKKLSKIKKK
ncbi:hypothetical protein [Viscerimonas tarda]